MPDYSTLAGDPASPSAPAVTCASMVTPGPRLLRFGDLLDEWADDAHAAHNARTTGTARGPLSGFSALDRELGGALWPGIHILHGQPGTGKTGFALQVAAQCGCPAIFVSCEMSVLELLRRHTARVTATYLGRFKSGDISPEESIAKVHQAVAATPELALIDATLACPSPQWISERALACRGSGRHLLIVIDSLHSWAQGLSGELSEYEALNGGLQGIRQIAGTLNCPVLVVAERNRASMERGGLSAGAGTRRIEYCAETVLDLERLEGEDRITGESGIVVTLAKNRHGAAGRQIRLSYHGALQRFCEVS